MAYATVTIPGDGVTTLITASFALGEINREHTSVRVSGEVDGSGNPVYRTFTRIGSSQFQVNGTPAPIGQFYIVERRVPKEELLVDWEDDDPITEANLNTSQKQALMVAQEALDAATFAVRTNDNTEGPEITRGPVNTVPIWDAAGNLVVGPTSTDIGNAAGNAAIAVQARDQAVSARNSAQTAQQIAQDAAASADIDAASAYTDRTLAQTSRTEAQTARTDAQTAASTATTKASEAASSASTANTASSTATTAKDQAVSARDTAVGARDTAVTKASEASTSASQAAASAAAAKPYPIGGVMMVWGNGNTPPPGFLLMNGASVTSAYPALRAYGLANAWPIDGNGDPVLANMGGKFPRGWVPGQAVDSGRVFGSSQLDAMQGHKHRSTGGSSDPNAAWANLEGQDSVTTPSGAFQGIGTYMRTYTSGPITDGVNGTPRMAAETRPVNETFTFWIKAYEADQVPGSVDFAALANNVQTLQNSVNALGNVGRKHGPKVAPSSVTSVLYTGLPANIRRAKINLRGLSFSPNAAPLLRLGTSAGVVSTGYVGGTWAIASSTGYASAPIDTTGIVILGGANANPSMNGYLEMERVEGTDNWLLHGLFFLPAGSYHSGVTVSAGVTLPGALDRILVATSAGTASISAVGIWVDWEF